jgi:hypothetical protein
MFKNLKLGTIVTASLIFGLSGCSVKQDTQTSEKIVELQKQIESKDIKISELEGKVSKDTLLPPNARAGECYTKVIIPAIYETKESEQLIKEADTKIEVIPATYKTVQKKVQVREETIKLIPVPATYKTEIETVMVEPEKTILEEVPATYKTLTEQILVKDAHTIWEKGRGEVEKIDTLTGEILCLVEVPAVYKTVERTVIDTPATIREVKIPAVYKTVEKKVVDVPATTREIKIPAVYKTVEKEVIDTPATTKEVRIPGICKMVDIEEVDTPAREVKTEIPAVYATLKTEVRVSEPDFKWEPILCETNSTTELISNLQTTLKDRGYRISNIDGVYNKETQKAVSLYQEQNNLVKGALTIETLKHLNLQ